MIQPASNGSRVSYGQIPEMLPVADLMAVIGIVPSKSAARRAIAEGGAYLNNRKVAEPDARPGQADLLHGRFLVLRRGKRTVAGITVERG